MLSTRRPNQTRVGWAWVLVMMWGVFGVPAQAQQAKKISVLHIGTSGSLALNASGTKEETALDALKDFIKDETGFDNEIIKQKNYQELTQKMARGELELGVFPGYEFAVQAKDPKLQALALAVDVYPYRYAYLMVRRDGKITDFAALKGQALSLPNVGQPQLRLYVEHLSEAQGQPLQAFFSKISTPNSWKMPWTTWLTAWCRAAVVDLVGLEAYARRKPGRFNRLKVLMHSQPFPPPLVAYYDNRRGSSHAAALSGWAPPRQPQGKGTTATGAFPTHCFHAPPPEWTKVLAETRKDYPPPK